MLVNTPIRQFSPDFYASPPPAHLISPHLISPCSPRPFKSTSAAWTVGSIAPCSPAIQIDEARHGLSGASHPARQGRSVFKKPYLVIPASPVVPAKAGTQSVISTYDAGMTEQKTSPVVLASSVVPPFPVVPAKAGTQGVISTYDAGMKEQKAERPCPPKPNRHRCRGNPCGCPGVASRFPTVPQRPNRPYPCVAIPPPVARTFCPCVPSQTVRLAWQRSHHTHVAKTHQPRQRTDPISKIKPIRRITVQTTIKLMTPAPCPHPSPSPTLSPTRTNAPIPTRPGATPMPKPQPAKTHEIANQPAQMHPHSTTTIRPWPYSNQRK